MIVDEFLSPSLITMVVDQFLIDPKSIHGPLHWARVLENGFKLADLNGADKKIVAHFALLHDCRRECDQNDPGHGKRAVEYVDSIRLDLDPVQIIILRKALAGHTTTLHSTNINLATCWDADRLDISRCFRKIDPRLLSTKEAKDPEILAWAQERGEMNVIPDWYDWSQP